MASSTSRERSGFADAKERLHPTQRAAILADIEAVLENPGFTRIVTERAPSLAPLLAELVEVDAASGPDVRAVRAA